MLYIQINKKKANDLFSYYPPLYQQTMEDESGIFFFTKKSIGFFHFAQQYIDFAVDVENFGILINRSKFTPSQEFKEKILMHVVTGNH